MNSAHVSSDFLLSDSSMDASTTAWPSSKLNPSRQDIHPAFPIEKNDMLCTKLMQATIRYSNRNAAMNAVYSFFFPI